MGSSSSRSEARYAPTINPATEEPLAEVAQAGADDVVRAVAAARAAQPAWAALPGLERGKYVFRIARLIQERARELAIVETLDGGKPIKESRDVDIPLAAAHFFYYAGWADKLAYALPGDGAVSARAASSGQVIPWNFPLLMAAWKLAPALATGNTAVLKPADTTPLTALLLAEILPGGRAARRRGQHPARRRLGRRRARARRGHRQGRLHRLDRGRPRHPGRAGGQATLG